MKFMKCFALKKHDRFDKNQKFALQLLQVRTRKLHNLYDTRDIFSQCEDDFDLASESDSLRGHQMFRPLARMPHQQTQIIFQLVRTISRLMMAVTYLMSFT